MLGGGQVFDGLDFLIACAHGVPHGLCKTGLRRLLGGIGGRHTGQYALQLSDCIESPFKNLHFRGETDHFALEVLDLGLHGRESGPQLLCIHGDALEFVAALNLDLECYGACHFVIFCIFLQLWVS